MLHPLSHIHIYSAITTSHPAPSTPTPAPNPINHHLSILHQIILTPPNLRNCTHPTPSRCRRPHLQPPRPPHQRRHIAHSRQSDRIARTLALERRPLLGVSGTTRHDNRRVQEPNRLDSVVHGQCEADAGEDAGVGDGEWRESEL